MPVYLSPLKAQSQPLNKCGEHLILRHGDRHGWDLTSSCRAEHLRVPGRLEVKVNHACRSLSWHLALGVQNVLPELTETLEIPAIPGQP